MDPIVADVTGFGRLAAEIRLLGQTPSDKPLVVTGLLQSVPWAANLVYARVTAVVKQDADMYLASIGNVMAYKCNVGLLKCRSAFAQRIAEQGYCIDANLQSNNRGPAIHSKEHAAKEVGATVLVSVPIYGTREEPSARLVGFLTFGWTGAPNLAMQYVPMLQQLAAQVAPGFALAMQDLCNDMVPFMPAPPSRVPREGSGPAPGGDGPPQDTNEGSPGPDAGCGSAALVQASSAWAGSNKLATLEGDSDWYAKKQGSALSSSGEPSHGGAAEVPAQSVWLTFKDANLEELFKLARAAHCHSADLWFTLLSLGMISANLRHPFLRGQPGFMLILPALSCKALLMTLCVNWYRKHRELLAILSCTLVGLGMTQVWCAYVTSPLVSAADKQHAAWREVYLSPAVHVSVHVGTQLPFATAAAIQAPILLATSQYKAVQVGATMWGWSVTQAFALHALPCLLVHAMLLSVLYSWERKQRDLFAAGLPTAAVPS